VKIVDKSHNQPDPIVGHVRSISLRSSRARDLPATQEQLATGRPTDRVRRRRRCW